MSGPPEVGLCDSCRHQKVVRNTRGSSFSLCQRSREDERYPRYPRLPVVRCPGHEPRAESAAEAPPVRCWPTSDPLYIAYHDEEWGRPVRDEQRLLERLCLEGFQSGLAWITILRKRENFRAAFNGFDPEQVARFGDADVRRLMADAGIVRNRAKIEATIANARATVALHDAGDTLATLLWSFAPAVAPPPPRSLQDMPASTAESKALARELKRRGFRFVGPTTAYALMQATGIVNDHLAECVVRAAVEADRVAAPDTLMSAVPGGRDMADVPQDADELADSATPGAARHGIAEVRGQQAVPLSALHEGRFGRMFRDPQPLRPDDAALAALAKLVKESGSAAAGDNTAIPAGYTYLGQFVDHDLTFDPLSKLQKDNDPDALVDFRTPRFDLDCLYGSGPDDEPFMYEWSSPTNRGVKLLVGRNPDNGQFDIADLPRNQQGRALIGDPRNDENIIVSQLQLLFIRFHNKVVDRTRKNQQLAGAALFEEAQRITRWHYQWIVVHDFLERIVGRETAQAILIPGSPTKPAETDIRFMHWQNGPFMPVEFSGAAYRYGHSQVRAAYDLNDVVLGVPIFVSADKPAPLEHLGGFRRLPAFWTIDWSLFFKTSASATPQLSRKIDTSISAPLFKLPGLPGDRPALPLLNLKRGRALGLPSGQDVAAAMGAPALTTAQLGLDTIDLPPAGRAALQRATPLWFYLLREAALLGRGERLGMVGGRIVAEVLLGLLRGDPQSYLSRKPTWTPILPSAKPGDFTMPDLVKFTLG